MTMTKCNVVWCRECKVSSSIFFYCRTIKSFITKKHPKIDRPVESRRKINVDYVNDIEVGVKFVRRMF